MQKLFRFLLVLFIIFFVSFNSHPQVFRVIESSSDQITIKFNFSNSYNIIDTIFNGLSYQKIKGEDNSLRNPGEPWLPEYIVLSGIPFNCNPTISILEQNQSLKKNQMIVPYPDGNPDFVKKDFEKINKSIYSKDENFLKQEGCQNLTSNGGCVNILRFCFYGSQV